MTDIDEFHGVGGSYIMDPKTGKRTRVEEPTRASAPPLDAPAGGEAPAAEEKPKSRRVNPPAAASGD